MKDLVNGKPLIELLWMATERGIIRKWSVEGPRVILHRGAIRFSIPAISAGSFLRQLLIDQDSATMMSAYRSMSTPADLPSQGQPSATA